MPFVCEKLNISRSYLKRNRRHGLCHASQLLEMVPLPVLLPSSMSFYREAEYQTAQSAHNMCQLGYII